MRNVSTFALVALLAACKPSAPPPTAPGPTKEAAPAGQTAPLASPKAVPAAPATPAAAPDADPETVPVPDDFRPPTLGAEVSGGTPTGAAQQTLKATGWTIEHSFSKGVATHDKTGRKVPLWAARTDCTGYTFEAGLASLVGTRLTYRFSERGTCSDTPSRGSGFETIDLASGKNVALTSLFAAAEIDAALAADSWLSNARSKPGIFKCLYREEALKAHHFAFQSLSADRVVVRLGLGHGCDSHKGLFTQLDLTLTPKPALRTELEAAKASGTLGEHLLLTLVAPPKKE